MNRNNIKNNIILVVFIILITKCLGMFRDVILANYYGTTNISDAYLIASSVPTLVFYFIGHALSTAFIPMYNKIKEEKNESEAIKYTNSLINISLIISTVLFILIMVFPNFIVRLFAAGFDNDTNIIASQFIRISSFSLFLMVLINIFSSYLQIHKNFVIPAFISFPRNIIIILSIILSDTFKMINILPIGILIGYFSELIFILFFIKNYKYSLKINANKSYIKETLAIIVPIFIGVAVNQINKIIDKSLASSLPGAISALNYASTINNAIQELLISSIITFLFANCSSLAAQNKHDEIKIHLSKAINVIIFILIPTTVGIIALSEEITEIFFLRGKFDSLSLQMTSISLIFYAIGMPFVGIRDTLVKVFYAYKKTKITTIISIISILLNIVLNFIFMPAMGVGGLALATSISNIFNSVILYCFLFKFIGDFKIKDQLINLFKTLISTSLLLVLILIAKKYIAIYSLSPLISIFIIFVFGVAVYLISNIFLKNATLYYIRKYIRKKD